MATDAPTAPTRISRLTDAYWLFLTFLLGLPLISPLLRWSAVPCTHDGHLHYHRIAALKHMWENGVYLSRWMPDLAFGYGYPFFIYREGPPLYIPLIPHLLGLPLPAASNLFYILTILAAGQFMFLWVRDLFGPRAAIVSAVAYMAAPYVLVDALVRGNSPESLALPLFPLILWAGRRWVLFGRAWAFLTGVLALALLSLSHNISSFIFAPTVAVYLLALILFARKGAEEKGSRGEQDGSPAPPLPRTPAFLRLVALLALGIGLAFFYTGGALLEMDQVTLEQSTTTRNNDWRYNFAGIAEILSPAAPEDPWLVNPPLKFRLGWAPMALAFVGATGLLWIRGKDGRAREQRLHIALMLAAAALYLFMALPLSRLLWETLPLIDFVQFPWRFVGRAALPVAFLAGVGVYWVELVTTADRRGTTADHRPPTAASSKANGAGQPLTTSDRQSADKENSTSVVMPSGGGRPSAVGRRFASSLPALVTCAAVVLLFLETLPNLYPRYCHEEPFPTILTVHTYEHVTGLVGVDPEGSYFPRTVVQRPSGSPLEADYQTGRTPQRFDATALPPGATLADVHYGKQGVTLTVDAPASFTARYLSFAFPGWSAAVDGQPVPITSEDPSGLITFAVPAGTHAVEVRWGATPARLALVALSVACALVALSVFFVARRRQSANWPGYPRLEHPDSDWIMLIALAIGLAAFTALDGARVKAMSPVDPQVKRTLTLLGGELALTGYSLDHTEVHSGETFDIDMAWKAIAPPTVDYQTNVWLQDKNGLLWSDKATERPRLYEDAAQTRLWQTGEWGWDSREVRVLPGTPPGEYDLVVTLFDKATLQPVTLTDGATGEVVGPTATIGQVLVDGGVVRGTPRAQYPLEADVPGTALRLLGYNQDRAEAAPGDPLLLTLFLSCIDASGCNRVRLSLLDAQGQEAQTWDLPAVREGLPAGAWPVVGYLRGQHLLQLPADLETGDYRFRLNDAVELGALAVTAPERSFDQPLLAVILDSPFFLPAGEPAATLAGIAGNEAALPPCAPAPLLSCSIPLVWRAESLLPAGYHVFVHLVDEAGNILAQSDSVPANWTRPTTGWLPGEYILDEHTLALPASLPDGPLTLRAGLYDPKTGVRLQTTTADYVEIQALR